MTTLKKKTISLNEPKIFLKNHPEIKSFDIIMHDYNAIGRGKIIRRNELLNCMSLEGNFHYLCLEWILLVKTFLVRG